MEDIRQDIAELKIIVTKQEVNLQHCNKLLEQHIKRSETLEDLFDILKQEHELTKQLLLNRIEAEQIKQENRSEAIWLVARTIFYTLSSVGAVLLALKELEVFDKLF